MSREAVVEAIAELTERLVEVWGGAIGKDQIDEHLGNAHRWLRGLSTNGRPAQPLVEGSPDSIPVLLPPHRRGDLYASLHVSVGPDGEAGQVQLVTVVTSELGAICVRFETPERLNHPDDPGNEGVHDFHHSQQSEAIRGADMPELPSLPDWYPDSRLAIPVPAQDPIDLVLCAILSVRHPAFLRNLATGATTTLVDRVQRLLINTGAAVRQS